MELDDKNEQMIVTSQNQHDLSYEEEKLKNPGSKENLLHLKKGSKACAQICTFFVICLVTFGVSLGLALTYERAYMFVLMGLAGAGILYCFILFTCCNAWLTINPNEAVVFQYFGRYLGTVKDTGFFYGYPLATTRTVSLRSNQFNGSKLKVNERDGNPVELGIIVVWRIGDTAKAIFDVIGYEEFIHTQSEAAIRYIGCKYPYEPIVPGEISLRGGQEIINKELRRELEKRVRVSGIVIEDARVTEISYGSEVAKMMLQKQASIATVYAKDAIVKGAAQAVVTSLNEFQKYGIQFSNEEKVKYVHGMMNTLCMSSDVSKIIDNN